MLAFKSPAVSKYNLTESRWYRIPLTQTHACVVASSSAAYISWYILSRDNVSKPTSGICFVFGFFVGERIVVGKCSWACRLYIAGWFVSMWGWQSGVASMFVSTSALLTTIRPVCMCVGSVSSRCPARILIRIPTRISYGIKIIWYYGPNKRTQTLSRFWMVCVCVCVHVVHTHNIFQLKYILLISVSSENVMNEPINLSCYCCEFV